MMRIYNILRMDSRVEFYLDFLFDEMKMDVNSISKMYDSVSITTEELLRTIKDEEEGHWDYY